MNHQEWLLRYLNPNEWGIHGNNEMGWFIDNRIHWCKTEIDPETREKYNSGWNAYYLLKDGTVHENLCSKENYFKTKEEAQKHLKTYLEKNFKKCRYCEKWTSNEDYGYGPVCKDCVKKQEEDDILISQVMSL